MQRPEGKHMKTDKKEEIDLNGENKYTEENHPGRIKCDKLRAIRKKIAEVNDIEFETAECHHTGPCAGTCPVCDEEIRYLDEQIEKKKKRGEEVYIVNIAVSEDICEEKTSDYSYSTTTMGQTWPSSRNKDEKDSCEEEPPDYSYSHTTMGQIQPHSSFKAEKKRKSKKKTSSTKKDTVTKDDDFSMGITRPRRIT